MRHDLRPALPPFPSGWYAVATSAELPAGGLRSGTWLGRELVLWRTASGVAHAADAHCPHMGAHFGHGGRVCGEHLECPFHRFQFAGDGQCVSTPYGSLPKRATLRTWTVVEQHGAILLWFDEDGRAPRFEPPRIDEAGWSPFRYHAFPEMSSHPQETSENSVDIGHFTAVHGYWDVEELAPLSIDGPVLRVEYAFTRRLAALTGRVGALRARFTATLYGLGYSFVETEIEALGVATRHLVLSTPTRDGHLALRVGDSLRRVGPGGLLGDAVTRLASKAVHAAFVDDVSADLEIWRNKRYVHPPALARGDGPVGRYRSWARQFDPGVGARDLAASG